MKTSSPPDRGFSWAPAGGPARVTTRATASREPRRRCMAPLLGSAATLVEMGSRDRSLASEGCPGADGLAPGTRIDCPSLGQPDRVGLLVRALARGDPTARYSADIGTM